MMWIFEPQIAEKRKTYHRIMEIPGLASMSGGQRTAKITKTDSPEMFPLDPYTPAEIEIEFTDNKGKKDRKRVTAGQLDILNPRNGCDLLVISGPKKGEIVTHARTMLDKVKVRLAGEKGLVTLMKVDVCPVQS